jgi:hypothetical protein
VTPKLTFVELVQADDLGKAARRRYLGYLHERDPHCCYCRVLTVRRNGSGLGGDTATLDHLLPESRGGRHVSSNLDLACEDCNVTKGDMTPIEFRHYRMLMARGAKSRYRAILIAKAACARLTLTKGENNGEEAHRRGQRPQLLQRAD